MGPRDYQQPGRIWPLGRGEGQGRTRVELILRPQGRDLLLTVTGGEGHVGAVAVCAPPGPAAAEGHESLVVVPGHKEGPLAVEGARRVAAAAGCVCCAVVGIHQDRASADEIAAIVTNVQRGYERLLDELSPAGSGPPGRPTPPGKDER